MIDLQDVYHPAIFFLYTPPAPELIPLGYNQYIGHKKTFGTRGSLDLARAIKGDIYKHTLVQFLTQGY